MEQNVDFDLIEAIMKKEGHTRGLAQRLGTNHMTVSRRLARLVSENVLDVNIVGRNKVYSLKLTTEARNWVIMTEASKLNRVMARYPELRRVITLIRKDPRVSLAILFGSHAKGTARKDSDIDVFVETRDKALRSDLERMDSRLSIKIGDYDRSNPLILEMERAHVIIKGVEMFYERNGLFKEAA